MRLICPNCDAEYAVDDSAIPPTGRDVQCSSCGHAWFQMRVEVPAPELVVVGAAPEPVPEPVLVDVTPEAPPEPEPAAEAADPVEVEILDAPAPVATVPPPAEVESQPVVAARRQLDENLLAVLREEAAREAAVRKTEGSRSIESQPDLGLEDQPRHVDLAATPAPEEHLGDGEKPHARRDLLPDIEEINSTLRAGADPRGAEGEFADGAVIARRRSGFRTGFLGIVLIAAIGFVTYVMAPQIAGHLPATEAAMNSYVQSVDAGRLWLDGLMQRLAGAIRGIGGEG